MEANYPYILKKMLRYEGGFANHPKDPGGRTLQGVTQAVYDKYRKKKGRPTQKLTAGMMGTPLWEAEMAEIYRGGYWLPVQGPTVHHGVDGALFDYGVNSGPGRAIRVAQKLCGRPVTGRLTADDVTAINKRSPAQLVDAICDERLAFVKSLRTWRTFGGGWTSRIRDVRNYCGALARGKKPIAATSEPSPAGKAQVPKTTKTKGAVIAGGGAAGGGAGATFGDWIVANPAIVCGTIIVAIVGVAFLFYKLDQWRDRQQNTPMDVPVLPEVQ